MGHTPPSFRAPQTLRTTWRNGGWLQESWSNRAARPNEDPRAALRKCMVLSHLPIEVERALRDIPLPRSLPVQPRRVERRSPVRIPSPQQASSSAYQNNGVHDDASVPRPVSEGFAELTSQSVAPNLLSIGLLLAFVPPVGIFAVWSLPSYPRDGKIAASVGAMVWMLMLGLCAAIVS